MNQQVQENLQIGMYRWYRKKVGGEHIHGGTCMASIQEELCMYNPTKIANNVPKAKHLKVVGENQTF